ncbi:4-hydroxythreonine-4-phosphate dehydrogenase, partial [Elioraea sp. Yellowstone]
MRSRPLALTMGDPAGIGGEITLAAWSALRARGPAFVAIDDPDRLAALAHRLGRDVPVRAVGSAAEG